MALIKSITDKKGVTYDYHRLGKWTTEYNVDHTRNIRGEISSYINAAAKTAGSLPIARSRFFLAVPDDATELSITQSYIYDQMLKLPEWSDAISDTK